MHRSRHLSHALQCRGTHRVRGEAHRSIQLRLGAVDAQVLAAQVDSALEVQGALTAAFEVLAVPAAHAHVLRRTVKHAKLGNAFIRVAKRRLPRATFRRSARHAPLKLDGIGKGSVCARTQSAVRTRGRLLSFTRGQRTSKQAGSSCPGHVAQRWRLQMRRVPLSAAGRPLLAACPQRI